MPEDKLKEWMVGTVSAVSGSMDVYNTSTKYKEAVPDEVINLIFGDVDRKLVEELLERDKTARAIIDDFIRTYKGEKKKEK